MNTLFLGTHKIKLDKKSRISLPAFFRNNLGPQFVLTLSPTRKCIDGCSLAYMENIAKQSQNKNIFSQEYDALTLYLFANSEVITSDKEGRCSLPTPYIQHASLCTGEEALCVGAGQTFQIWNCSLFQEYKSQILKQPTLPSLTNENA